MRRGTVATSRRPTPGSRRGPPTDEAGRQRRPGCVPGGPTGRRPSASDGRSSPRSRCSWRTGPTATRQDDGRLSRSRRASPTTGSAPSRRACSAQVADVRHDVGAQVSSVLVHRRRPDRRPDRLEPFGGELVDGLAARRDVVAVLQRGEQLVARGLGFTLGAVAGMPTTLASSGLGVAVLDDDVPLSPFLTIEPRITSSVGWPVAGGDLGWFAGVGCLRRLRRVGATRLVSRPKASS